MVECYFNGVTHSGFERTFKLLSEIVGVLYHWRLILKEW
ncbi:hypothetical protein [uncultured Gammaproteobacteria bacterium]|uniref:Uncharacterized protein n=1 Tax=Bathymodiolus azoricus thioautotrophic gill symbiont TaxID=235205 RepID=A0A1H6MAF7_9GAMM|nr:hypothetical protein [uncultured Gammaproteobacteria bacterium]SEH98361.1 hypothetical protein BAZSYMA_ACONTIG00162_0 [Bathymodiolus azoricus thioautotrophic gill symbiont]